MFVLFNNQNERAKYWNGGGETITISWRSNYGWTSETDNQMFKSEIGIFQTINI